MEDDDLYGDLFQDQQPLALAQPKLSPTILPVASGSVAQVFHDHDLKELRSQLKDCQELLEVCRGQLIESNQKCAALTAERAVLVRNISVLFRTATLEVQRKAGDIRSLRQELACASAKAQAVRPEASCQRNAPASPGRPPAAATTTSQDCGTSVRPSSSAGRLAAEDAVRGSSASRTQMPQPVPSKRQRDEGSSAGGDQGHARGGTQESQRSGLESWPQRRDEVVSHRPSSSALGRQEACGDDRGRKKDGRDDPICPNTSRTGGSGSRLQHRHFGTCTRPGALEESNHREARRLNDRAELAQHPNDSRLSNKRGCFADRSLPGGKENAGLHSDPVSTPKAGSRVMDSHAGPHKAAPLP